MAEKSFSKNSFVIITVMCVFVIIFIFVYGYLVRNVFKKDILELKVLPLEGADVWAVSHMIFFMILGYMFPERLLLLTTLGVSWEMTELALGSKKWMLFGNRIQLVGDTDENGNIVKPEEAKEYWYARQTDCLWDVLGLVIGVSLKKYFYGEVCF